MKNILITGASSGLGAEFADQYAAQNVKLFLCGRNIERLNEVAASCRRKGAEVFANAIDVTDRALLADWITTITAQHGLDLVIANAGISGGFSGQVIEDITKDYQIFDINLMGVLNTIYPALPHMVAKKSGHIVLISSLASYVPMPSAPAYSASKVAVRFYGESLRTKLAAFNVKVTVICPGFIESRMTDKNDFPMPFMMKTDVAVARMINEISLKKPRISFPWQMSIGLKLLALIPAKLSSAIFAWLPDKKSLPND
jgi:short-subunit dehydrogenase